MWRMRLQQMSTLQHYLQEVLAATSLNRLSEAAKAPTRLAAAQFAPVIRLAAERLSAGDWRPLGSQLGPGPRRTALFP